MDDGIKRGEVDVDVGIDVDVEGARPLPEWRLSACLRVFL